MKHLPSKLIKKNDKNHWESALKCLKIALKTHNFVAHFDIFILIFWPIISASMSFL